MAEVTAAEKPKEITVDPGQIVTITVKFNGDPKRVSFSYMGPDDKTANADLDYGKEGSKITRAEEGVYRRAISTKQMRGGMGWWYFLGEYENPEDPRQRAKIGKFIVRDAPPQLLGLPLAPSAPPPWLLRPVVWGIPGWGVVGIGGIAIGALAVILSRRR